MRLMADMKASDRQACMVFPHYMELEEGPVGAVREASCEKCIPAGALHAFVHTTYRQTSSILKIYTPTRQIRPEAIPLSVPLIPISAAEVYTPRQDHPKASYRAVYHSSNDPCPPVIFLVSNTNKTNPRKKPSRKCESSALETLAPTDSPSLLPATQRPVSRLSGKT